jgi:adenosylcobinamide kinase / adenosylcobinamide-phosphate guanylyltransferase
MKRGTLLVLGGARSGKSAFAEQLVAESGLERLYLATALAGDAEMEERIAHHRAGRDIGWRTVEEPHGLEAALIENASAERAILVDCLTLWLSNLMLAGADLSGRTERLCRTLTTLPGFAILVSNEVGMGLVPDNRLGRDFRDAQGRLNQAVAAIADKVVFVAAGLPLYLKGAP